MSQIKKMILSFLKDKGANLQDISDETFLLEHIQSVDFMEMIVHIETVKGAPLDMATADIESIMTFGGFIQWVEQENV